MNRRTGLLFVPLALSAAAAFAGPTTAVRVERVSTRSLADTVTAYGRLVPDPGALQWLSAAQSGRVSAVLVTAGSTVARGQALVRIEPTPQTLAAYQSAKSALVSAKAKLDQTRSLAQNGLATRADLAAAEGSVASAKARLAALRSEGVGATAEALKASMAGVVTQVPVARGDWVNAGSRIAALAPAGALWVRLGLAPEQAARVKPRADVRIAPVFGAGKTLASHVAKVDAQANSATGLIDVEVPVPAGDAGPFVGEWVAGTITLRRFTLPAVARSAVLKDARGYYVFVVRNGTAHRVTVTPVVRDHGLVGLEGIRSGATVVTQGNFELSDGDAVRITNPKDPS